jgi:two-component system, cell cycle response regulator DivK
VIKARNGQEGVDLAIKENPDLILMDIQLPDFDGLETTRRIRKSHSTADVPIIALTSYAMAGDRQKALKAGCNGYIEKPINPDTIMDEIEKYLKI